MERKHFLATMGGAAALAGGLPASAAGKIVFAGLFPSSGTYATYGRGTERGFQLAINETQRTVAGFPIEYISRDTQTTPDIGRRQATEAYARDGARFFAGSASSAVALAIADVARSKGALFFTSVGADEITGRHCNAYTFRWSVPAYGAVRATMYPFLAKFPDAKKWYTITPSYVFGESLLTNVKGVAQEKGLQLVGNAYHSLGATEFTSIIAKVAAAKPDVLALLNFDRDAMLALKAASDAGLKKTTKILYVWSGGLLDFATIGPALEGVYAGCQYWHDASPATRVASEAYKAVYGEPLGYAGASGYIEAKLTLQGIANAKSADPANVAKVLEGFTYTGPTGPEQIRAFDHQVIKPYCLLLGKAQGAMKDRWDYVDTLASQSYPVPRERSLCRL